MIILKRHIMGLFIVYFDGWLVADVGLGQKAFRIEKFVDRPLMLRTHRPGHVVQIPPDRPRFFIIHIQLSRRRHLVPPANDGIVIRTEQVNGYRFRRYIRLNAPIDLILARARIPLRELDPHPVQRSVRRHRAHGTLGNAAVVILAALFEHLPHIGVHGLPVIHDHTTLMKT